MIKFDIMAGSSIYSAAQMLANAPGPCYAMFNDTRIECTDFSNPDKKAVAAQIVSKWESDRAIAQEAWRNGPEGQAYALRQKFEGEKHDQILNGLIRQMDQNLVDFGNDEQVLQLLVKCQDSTDCILTSQNVRNDFKTKLLFRLKAFGFKSNDCTGKQFNGEDPANFARYIIGQAMDGLQSMGAIHQMVHIFTGQWMTKFGSTKKA